MVNPSELTPWHRVLYDAEQVEHLLLPKYRASMMMYTDTSKRQSKCAGCGLLIPKKTRRAVFAIRTGGGVATRYPNGGYSTLSKCYLHVQCVEAVLGDVTRVPVGNLCADCGQDVGSYECRVQTGSLYYGWGRICHPCSISKRYALCDMCQVLAPKQRTSIRTFRRGALNAGDERDINIVCDNCSINYDVSTVKQIKRAQTAENQLDNRMYRAIEQIEDWVRNRSK